MELNFDKVQESNYPDWLDLGIHEVELTGVESNEDNPDKPYLTVVFVGKDGQHKEKFYMSEKAMPISNKKLYHIADACDITKEALKECPDSDALNNLFVNHKMKIKISGEEYINREGETRMQKGLFARKFCAKIDDENLYFTHNKQGEFGDVKYIKQPERAKLVDPAPGVTKTKDVPF